jgi:hypothetical protein
MEENKEMHFTNKYGDKTQSNKSIHGHHSSDPPEGAETAKPVEMHQIIQFRT